MPQPDPDPALDAAFVRRWITLLDQQVAGARQLLNGLDAAIGDADHGTNMTRGLAAARTALEASPPATPASACGDVGRAMVASIGGASGPLFGTVFIALGRALPEAAEVAPTDVVGGLRESLRAVQQLGAAVAGDKTMIDAIAPAVAELEARMGGRGSLPEALKWAAAAAHQGAVDTIPLRARKGRASYLGPRSEGHQDPGATSSAMLFESLHAAVRT